MWWLALFAFAPAGGSIEVVLAPTEAAQELPAHRVEAVGPRVATALESFDAVNLTPSEAPLEATCTAPSCLRQYAGEGATHVMRVELSARDQDYDLRLSLLEIRTGNVVASAAGGCDLCTDVEIGEMAARTATRMREPITALGNQPALVVVDGLPAGAAVSIDGAPVGEAPVQAEVSPGRHQVIVSLPGHESYTHGWVAEGGQTHTETYQLRELERKRESRALRIGGWTAFAIGLAGIGGGAGITALHNRPDKSSCPDGQSDPNGRCPRMYDTLGAGLATMGAGLLVAGAGAAMIGVDAKRRRAHVAFSPRHVEFRLRF